MSRYCPDGSSALRQYYNHTVPFLFVIFVDRISRHTRGSGEGPVRWHWARPLLFLQTIVSPLALFGPRYPMCTGVVLSRGGKKMSQSSGWWAAAAVGEVQGHFHECGLMCETVTWPASLVQWLQYCTLCHTLVIKREHSKKAKFTFLPFSDPNLIVGF